MNAKTLEAVTNHGRQLLALFPNAIEQDPVALCKKLRRIEVAISRPILEYCNGENGMTCEKLDVQTQKAMERVQKLLFADGVISEERICGLHVNRDPRGYALKLSSEWAAGKAIYTDWGGYGILAPDLTTK